MDPKKEMEEKKEEKKCTSTAVDETDSIAHSFHWFPSNDEKKVPDDEMAKIVFQLKDPNTPLLEFDNILPEECHRREWLWQMKGQICVLSVPFREGTHVATKLSQFVPILDHLLHLHNHGMVHGDIRAYNMIFGCDQQSKSWLIDLDFGGKHGNVSYPLGYRSLLPDGTRVVPNGKRPPIEKSHDYLALWNVMNGAYLIWQDGASEEFKNQKYYWEKFFAGYVYGKDGKEKPLDALDVAEFRKFVGTEDVRVTPKGPFHNELKRRRQSGNNNDTPDKIVATGSAMRKKD